MLPENETLNLKASQDCCLGEIRLKERVVVSRRWFMNLISLFAQLELMTRGQYWDGKETLPPNLDLKKEMIDNDFDGWVELYKPLLKKK